MEDLRDHKEFVKLEKMVKHLSFSLVETQKDIRELTKTQREINAELRKQIERRPVSMRHIQLELYDNVSEQVSQIMARKLRDFETVVSNYFFNARLVPKGSVSDEFDPKVKLKVEEV